MATKQLTSTILLAILSFSCYGQKVPGGYNFAPVLETWKKTVHCIKTRDTAALRRLCADTIQFIEVDKKGENSYKYLPLPDFLRLTFDSIVPDKNMQKAWERNKPRVQADDFYFKDGSKHRGYSVIFYQRNRRQNTEKDKYQHVIFTYVDSKLSSIVRR